MLVLSRQRDESVVLSKDGMKITCTVPDIRNDKVRLGFTAPSDVVVDRMEVSLVKERERREDALHG
jgi:carbon storage regulator CsrA